MRDEWPLIFRQMSIVFDQYMTHLAACVTIDHKVFYENCPMKILQLEIMRFFTLGTSEEYLIRSLPRHLSQPGTGRVLKGGGAH